MSGRYFRRRIFKKNDDTTLINICGGERMGKMRIYEYAKQNNTTSKEVVEQLGKLNYEVKNHMSSVTEPMRKDLDKVSKSRKRRKKINLPRVRNNTTRNLNKRKRGER